MQVRHVCHVDPSQQESGVSDLDAQLDLLATVTQMMTILQVLRTCVTYGNTGIEKCTWVVISY